MYVFSFPNDASRFNYTFANLVTSGTIEGDNVKYCYGTNIGSAIIPSSENCYRVSKDNSYTLKILNPLVMNKDYDLDDDLSYYVSLKPVVTSEKMAITPELNTYDTLERNIEGVANKIQISSTGSFNTILTAPENKDVLVFLQVQQCDNSPIIIKVLNAYEPSKTVLDPITIPADSKNFYKTFNNILLETELSISGNSGTNVFVKHAGVRNAYYPSIKETQEITFNQELNQLTVENPINNYERMKYTVLVSGSGGLSNKGITLCSFTTGETLSTYNKTVESYTEKTSIILNFNKAGLKAGDKFEVLVFTEQQLNSKMAFLSDIFTGTVGEISTKSFTEINTPYDFDNDYLYARGTASASELTYYFSYMPETTFDVAVGALSIELDNDAINGFSSVDCAFVDDGEDAFSMIEAIEDVIDSRNPYCIGGKSNTNGRIYNFIFRYSYTTNNKPRKLVIKISNGEFAVGGFTVFVRKGQNTYIENTGYDVQEEYGKNEEYKKTVMPYIFDLERIRGDSETDPNYVSKVLVFSQHLEMQMYYLDETGETNAPILLFTGNIMLVYTKPDLAIQKYHSAKLILLSENLSGQEHSSLGNQFRFHTKMYKSDAQIEYFVSNNPTGRTLNYPLSVEMNTCTTTNNKYYYILNYNKAEDERILYLDLVFGSMNRVRIANEINAEKWDDLIQGNSMTDINNYQINCPSKSQHIDVVEIECNTPLLANFYYNYEGQVFSGLELGDIAVKTLGGGLSTTITLNTAMSGILYYSISLFNPIENPNIVVKFGNSRVHEITENSLNIGFLMSIPESISINNNGNSPTRFIFKIGYGVESEWIDEGEKIEGKLYSKDNKYVYKFPSGDNRRNFTNVILNVKPMKKGSEEESPNVKFCYSTSIGMPIDVSLENCYRTGANIPYSLTFVNPLISPKNYKSYSDSYYVTLSPFNPSEYISLDIIENTYDTNERNIEGIGNIIKLEEEREKSTILSIPEVITNTNILLQLQLCDSTENSINYIIYNAYTQEEIDTFTLSKTDRFYTKPINNNLMETELKFIGQINDTIFIKHIGLTNYEIHLQDYKAVFEEDQNVVNIDKPILNEAFRVTVLVGRKNDFDNFTLCTFAEKSESQYKYLADYVNTFTSVSSNVITHYIAFNSFGYNVGEEFDLLVYAVQVNNAKIEILYNVISGKVGKIQDVVKIDDFIEGKSDYVSQKFIKNTTSNYLYYDFGKNPTGFVASLKIKAESEVEEGMRVNKVGCIFVSPNLEDMDMIDKVNEAMREGTSVCIGESQKDSNGYDALINAMDLKSGSGNKRLVIQIIYGLGDDKKIKEEFQDESITMNITLRVTGVSVKDQDYGYNENEQLTLVPYVLDLLEIRGDSKENYISKVLLFSNTREMQMFYLDNGAPKELFSGNIMLVYTNPDVIDEKYYGATTMILVTDSLSATQRSFIGEQFRFKANFFDSKTTIQYYVSANPEGRLLNNPTSIEMLECDQPYYYILNYHYFEGDRILHIDNIFGEVDTMKIATQLNDNNWFDFVSNMEPFSENEYFIKEQTKYHMDVLEVTCKTPLLLNVYYTDPYVTKKTNLDQGDISIITLAPGTSETLTFKSGLEGEFIFSFNVQRSTNLEPNIAVKFEEGDEMAITQNGIFTRKTDEIYPLITIKNNQRTGSDQTKVIFKLGYVIENTFTKIENDVYNLQTIDRPANLFAYIFRNGDDRLNYTKYEFEVKTKDKNVKFCYSSNLGAFIDPSLQNCFRVGSTNSYTLSLLNPYVMYKNYYTEKEYMDYYVSFRTEDKELNITIIPNPIPYSTSLRNMEGYPTSIPVQKEEGTSTILTNPSNNKKYLFVQMHVCTKDKSIGYEFKNAYNNTSLGETGTIAANTINNFRNIENTNLDTLLTFEDLSSGDETTKVFVKFVGMNEKYQPIVNELTVTFDKNNKEFNFEQPISGEAFDYTIYVSNKNNLVNQAFTLCSFAEMSKLAPFSKTFSSISDEKVSIKLDFDSKDLKDLKQFDALVLAKQLNNGQLMILSNVVSGNAEGSKGGSNKVLVIILVILAIILVGGGIFLCIYLKRLKEKPVQKVIKAQATDLDDIQNANKGEKMLDSMAQSQAYENQS